MTFIKNNKLEKEFNPHMKKIMNIKKSSKRGIFLSIVILFSISLILTPLNGYAEEIIVKSVGVDKTSIITLTNESEKNVEMFRIWLSQDTNFQSFKTERGWIGEKTPQGVIIFTSSEPIKQNESVKFGIKTDKSNPIINWKALDQTSSTIGTGVIVTKEMKIVIENPEIKDNGNIKNNSGEIFPESTFKIIPDKPNSGSTIRVIGENFERLQEFDFYVNNEKIVAPLAKILSENSPGNGHVTITLQSDSQEIDVTLPDSYLINAKMRSAVKSLPGVIDVSDLWEQ